MNSSQISVIVPVYNMAKYLQRCIDSIISQTFENWELILINDGSTDESAIICQKYEEKCERIKLVNVSRGGVGRARNIGINQAKGDYIYFVDPDDYLNPTHLQNYAENIIKYDIVYQGYRLFDEKTNNTLEEKSINEIVGHNQNETINILCNIFEYGNFFGPTWNKIFHKSIINRYHIRFKEDISIREDEVFTFEYCQYVTSIKILSTASYNYQKTSNSLMRRKYIGPKEIMQVINYSYPASLQLPLSKDFRRNIDLYCTNSHVWLGRMLYYPNQLEGRIERLRYLESIWNCHKTAPTSRSKSFCKVNILFTDYYHVIRYFVTKVMFFLRIK